MRATFGTIGGGAFATPDTLHRMRQLVRDTYGLPIVRLTAVGIARGNGYDGKRQAALIFGWLRRYTRFIRDPYDLEALHEPPLILAMVAHEGRADVDCDDVAMLGAALGMAVGLPARFVAVWGEPDADGNTEGHVFAELFEPTTGEWYDLDIMRPSPELPDSFTHGLAMEV